MKIADFGMSRDVYERDYYKMDDMNKPLPMKWMAVESLQEGRYTSKSDVVRAVMLFRLRMWVISIDSLYPLLKHERGRGS